MTAALTIMAVMAQAVIAVIGLAVLCIVAIYLLAFVLTKYMIWRGIYKDFLLFQAHDAERRGKGAEQA